MRRSVIFGGIVFVSVFALAAMFSCSSGRVERQAVEVSVSGWSESVTWNYDNRNTQSIKDVAFIFDYADGDVKTDLANALAENIFAVEVVFPSGRRFDSAISPVVDGALISRIITSPDAPFDEKGIYKFTLTPLIPAAGVRTVTLELAPKTGKTGKSSGGEKQH